MLLHTLYCLIASTGDFVAGTLAFHRRVTVCRDFSLARDEDCTIEELDGLVGICSPLSLRESVLTVRVGVSDDCFPLSEALVVGPVDPGASTLPSSSRAMTATIAQILIDFHKSLIRSLQLRPARDICDVLGKRFVNQKTGELSVKVCTVRQSTRLILLSKFKDPLARAHHCFAVKKSPSISRP